MIEKLLSSTRVIEKSLDASALRNEIISNNIANIDTPGYKREQVSFEDILKNRIENNVLTGVKTNSRHISIGGNNVDEIDIAVSRDNNSTNMRIDGNNVDIEKEMSLLAQNSIKYNVMIDSLAGKYKNILSALSEGRR